VKHDDPAVRAETAADHEAHALPAPTIWPVVMALGITLLAAGIATNYFVSAGGAVLFVMAVRGWVRDLMDEWREHRYG
jgi:hypothetical protein